MATVGTGNFTKSSKGHPTREDRIKQIRKMAREFETIIPCLDILPMRDLHLIQTKRDSYNDSSVLWQLGLSWWRDIIPMLNKKHFLSVTKAKEFKEMVESRQIPEAPTTYDGKPVTIADCNYFVKARQELIDYLDQAIAEKQQIKCSL